MTGAKNTHVGCDGAAERLENIVECPALWHAKQSFLSVGWKFQLIVTWFLLLFTATLSQPLNGRTRVQESVIKNLSSNHKNVWSNINKLDHPIEPSTIST